MYVFKDYSFAITVTVFLKVVLQNFPIKISLNNEKYYQ